MKKGVILLIIILIVLLVALNYNEATKNDNKVSSEDMVFTHMSGMKQSREEYFSDIKVGKIKYYTIGIEKPDIKADSNNASITYTAILKADAYGCKLFKLFNYGLSYRTAFWNDSWKVKKI